jgi:hypothetical protein
MSSPNGQVSDAASGAFARSNALESLGKLRLDPIPNPAFRFVPGGTRVGIVSNPKSRRNRSIDLTRKVGAGVLAAAPTNGSELVETLRRFADRRIDLLVIDGGDGTVRDVMTAAAPVFGDDLPPIALSPSGKTNALALDLGIPLGWSVESSIAAWAAGRIQTRSPIDIIDEQNQLVRGFIFGASGFVRATALAQKTHRFGMIDGLAVGASLIGAIAQTRFGGATNPWRAGDRIRIVNGSSGSVTERNFYLIFGSTLHRLPLGLRVLGQPAPGLNILAVDAPPRMLLAAAAAIIAGREGGMLARNGYHHAHDVPPSQLTLERGFILDGERFPGGTIVMKAGSPVRFVTP